MFFMKEIADATFGMQLDHMAERHNYYSHSSFKLEDIVKQFPQLKGHETKMVSALGNAVAERMQLMGMYGSGGLALEIIEARRKPQLRLQTHIRENGDY